MFFLRKLFLLLSAIVLFVVVLLSGCMEDPVSLTIDTFVQQHDTLYAIYDTTLKVDQDLNNSINPVLFIGSAHGISIRTFMRFSGEDMRTRIPANASVKKAWIILQRFVEVSTETDTVAGSDGVLDSVIISNSKITFANGVAGEDIVPFGVTGYPINDYWVNNLDSVWEEEGGNVNLGIPLGSMVLDTVASGIDRRGPATIFRFNTGGLHWVGRWADQVVDQHDSTGIMFIADEGPSYLQTISSRLGLQDDPELFITYDSSGTLRTKSFPATSNGFLHEGDFTRLEDRTYTSTFTNWVTLLQFDLDALKRKYAPGFIVTSANLQLPIDIENAILNAARGPNLQIQALLSDIKSSEPPEIDASLSIFPADISQLTADENYVEIDEGGAEREIFVSSYLRLWIESDNARADSTDLEGFYIEPQLKDDFLNIIPYFRYNSSELSKRPRIIIESIPTPAEQF